MKVKHGTEGSALLLSDLNVFAVRDVLVGKACGPIVRFVQSVTRGSGARRLRLSCALVGIITMAMGSAAAQTTTKVLRPEAPGPSAAKIAAAKGPVAPDTLLLFPRPLGLVSDYAQVLTRREAGRLEQSLDSLRKWTGGELAVVTLHSLHNRKALDLATEFGRRWKVGLAYPPNHPLYSSGSVFVLGITDRAFALALGDGMSGWVPQARVDALLEAIRPLLRSGAYAQAFDAVREDYVSMVLQRKRSEPIGESPVAASLRNVKARVDSLER